MFVKVKLHGKCLYSEFFWSLFSCIWTTYENLHCKSPIQFESRKIRTRKTLNKDTLNVVWNLKWPNILRMSINFFELFEHTFCKTFLLCFWKNIWEFLSLFSVGIIDIICYYACVYCVNAVKVKRFSWFRLHNYSTVFLLISAPGSH